MRSQTKKLTTLALLSALAYLAMLVGRVPVVLFLKYDPKDVIVVIGGFLFGPLSAFAMSAVVSFVEMLTVSDTGLIGLVMNIISTCAFVCPAAFIYKRKRTLRGAAAGLVSGWLLATAVMLLWNYFLVPIYMGIPRAAVVELMLPALLPFNLLKGGLNAGFATLLYKPVKTALQRARLTPAFGQEAVSPGKANVGVILVSLFIIATGVFTILVFQGRL